MIRDDLDRGLELSTIFDESLPGEDSAIPVSEKCTAQQDRTMNKAYTSTAGCMLSS